jgi:hypothetical protein
MPQEKSFGVLGTESQTLASTDFFHWFHLEETGSGQYQSLELRQFQPSGPKYHDLTSVILISNEFNQLQGADLFLAREFIDNVPHGIFASDIAASFLSMVAEGAQNEVGPMLLGLRKRTVNHASQVFEAQRESTILNVHGARIALVNRVIDDYPLFQCSVRSESALMTQIDQAIDKLYPRPFESAVRTLEEATERDQQSVLIANHQRLLEIERLLTLEPDEEGRGQLAASAGNTILALLARNRIEPALSIYWGVASYADQHPDLFPRYVCALSSAHLFQAGCTNEPIEELTKLFSSGVRLMINHPEEEKLKDWLTAAISKSWMRLSEAANYERAQQLLQTLLHVVSSERRLHRERAIITASMAAYIVSSRNLVTSHSILLELRKITVRFPHELSLSGWQKTLVALMELKTLGVSME